MRSVFFIPDPIAQTRVPIAELTLEDDRVVLHRLPLPAALSREQATCVALARKDIEEQIAATCSAIDGKIVRGAPALDALPSSVGPKVVLGDLVRVAYPDGTSEDLDERTRCIHLPLSWIDAQGIRIATGSAYDDVAMTISEQRGHPVAVETSRDVEGWLAHGATVESWEQEARRLRQGIANLAHRFDLELGNSSGPGVRRLIQPKRRS